MIRICFGTEHGFDSPATIWHLGCNGEVIHTEIVSHVDALILLLTA